MAKIQLNGKKVVIKSNYSLLDLLKKYKLVNKKVAIEHKLSLSDIREQFIILCDNLNVDGILDPIRPY